MNDFGLTKKDRELILNVLKQFDQVKEVLIFGSRAMGNFKKTSDVDMALKGAVDFDTLAKINYQLNEVLPLPYHFDVVNYESISNPKLKTHVDEVGKLLTN